MSEETATLPFAPHSPEWEYGKTKDICIGVFDGRKINQDDDEWMDKFTEEVTKSASEFLGKPAELINGLWAGDFYCGDVLILYFQTEEKDVPGEKINP